MNEIRDNPRIDPPRAAENLAEAFLPRGFTVSRAVKAVRRVKDQRFNRRQWKRDSPSTELSLFGNLE
jgi:hypothetical protein